MLDRAVGVRHNAEREKTLLLGRETHKHIESAIAGRSIPSDTESGAVAIHALATIAKLPRDVECEKRLMLDLGDYGLDATADVISDSEHLITDWKTSSNPAKYALKESELRADPQAVALAFLAMALRGWPVANLKWAYLPTRPDRSPRTREIRFERAEIGAAFAAVDTKARRRLQIMREKEPVIVACFSECQKYRGCDHLAYCPAKQSLTGAMRSDGEITMSFDQSIIDRVRALAAQSAPQAAAPAPVAAPAPAGVDITALLASAGIGAPAPAPAPAPVATPAAAGIDIAALLASAGISPQQAAAAMTQAPAPPVVAPALDMAAILARAGVGQLVAAPVVAAAATPQAAPVAPTNGAGRKIAVLYIDCLPLDGASRKDAADILREVNQLIQRDAGLQHFALAEYGKGAGLVSIAVADVMTRFSSGDVVCVRQPQALVDALRAHASAVVMGCR